MTPAEIVTALVRHGTRIAVDGERVRLVFNGNTPPDDLVRAARNAKAALREIIAAAAPKRAGAPDIPPLPEHVANSLMRLHDSPGQISLHRDSIIMPVVAFNRTDPSILKRNVAFDNTSQLECNAPCPRDLVSVVQQLPRVTADIAAAEASAEVISPARDRWALRISEAWQKSVIAIITTGQLLIEAKAALPHGEWQAMIESSDLPFSDIRTVERLMAIARNRNIVNPAHCAALPPSWYTLYKLSLLSDVEFERGIVSGLIRPDMTRGEISYVKGTLGTGESEWFTPPEFVERARQVLGGIDLDPATCIEAQEIVRATRYFTKSEDGLQHEWRGKVWLNPPFARQAIEQFVDKLIGEYRAGRTAAAILLTHNHTDTAWFHRAEAAAALLCFTRGRVPFIRGDEIAKPTEGQTFFYFGRATSVFSDVFSEIGFVR
jgi:phage N-6-adenine-methyltransferase